MNTAIARQRLLNQRITGAKRAQPAEVVTWLGAVQAQEYPAAKWALALRMREGTTDARIDRAFDEGRILRTHVMRPTWHFVTPADIRWMLELTAPHVHRTMTTYNRRLELDSATLTRAIRVFERALRDGQFLTRAELGISLQRDGIEAKGQRLAHLTTHAELEAVICSGPRRGKQFTYALLAERAPSARGLPRDEALAELTRRYFTSHGPATARDFAWWSGLPAADSRRGLELIRARPQIVEGRKYWTTGRAPAPLARPGLVHLLPIYDEYLVAYQDRDAVPHTYSSIVSGPGAFVTFQHALVIRGQVAGTWRTARTASGMALNVLPTKQLTGSERRELANIASRFEQFLEAPVSLSIR